MQPGDFEVRSNLAMVVYYKYKVIVNILLITAPVFYPIFKITPQATSVGFYKNLDSLLSYDAVALAVQSDVSIIFTANNKEYESELFDWSSMSLSPLQKELIHMIAKAVSKCVLVCSRQSNRFTNIHALDRRRWQNPSVLARRARSRKRPCRYYQRRGQPFGVTSSDVLI